jgi:hypothetical protein
MFRILNLTSCTEERKIGGDVEASVPMNTLWDAILLKNAYELKIISVNATFAECVLVFPLSFNR